LSAKREKCTAPVRSVRLQEKKPGFNYDLSHEEFSKLFKK